MRVLETLTVLGEWQQSGRRAALAALVSVSGSAPRDPGASMLVAEDGTIHGSISGGCVEAAVALEAQAVLREGSARIVEFGISDEEARGVGLTCGGTLRVLVDEPDRGFVRAFGAAAATQEPLAVAVTLAPHPRRLAVFQDAVTGSLGSSELDAAVGSAARADEAASDPEIMLFAGQEIFIERVRRVRRMYVFGAVDFAAALLGVAKMLGYETTLCDARPAFATRERFPMADRIAVQWPDEFLEQAPIDEATAIVTLAHDEKFDIPLLRFALRSRAGYVGAMGSRRTNERRIELLRQGGVTAQECERLRAPIGLDIGGRTPEEMAIAIAAEILARRYGRSGGPLTGGSGSVRGRPGALQPLHE